MLKEILCFDHPGPKNTKELINFVLKRAYELKIRRIVVASRTGRTALSFAEANSNKEIEIVCVTHQFGHKEPGKWRIAPEIHQSLLEKKIPVVSTIMPLTTLGRIFNPSWEPPASYEEAHKPEVAIKISETTFYRTPFPLDVVADTLRLFSQGMKVCIEITLMAADTGAIAVDREIIAVGGTGSGADTAIVIMPSHTHRLFNLRIREIIAMPR